VDFLETIGLGSTDAKGEEEKEGLESTEAEGGWEEEEGLGMGTESREEEEMSTGILVELGDEGAGGTKKVSLVWSKQGGKGKGKQPSELGLERLTAKGNRCSWKITCLDMSTDLVRRLYNL
jgi:hypothetical protein